MAKGKRDAGMLHLVTGMDGGHGAWHLLLVDRLKYPLFLRALTAPQINVAEFGNVVASGWGEPPERSALEAMVCEGAV